MYEDKNDYSIDGKQGYEDARLAETAVTEIPPKTASLREGIRKTCTKLQLYIVLEPQFYTYTGSWITFAAAYYSSLVYLVPYGTKEMGLERMQATTLLSAVMCGEIGARIYYGFLFDRCTKEQRFFYSSILLFALGMVFSCFVLLRGYLLLLLCCGLMGLTCGGMDGLYSIFIVDLFGLKHYSAVFGFGNIPIHLSSMAATTLLGVMIDQTQNVTYVFCVAGASSVAASALTVLMRWLFLRKGPFVPSKCCA